MDIRVWIEGQSPRKSNQRQILRRGRGGPPFIAKSDAAIAWTKQAALKCPAHAKQGVGAPDSNKEPGDWLEIIFFMVYKNNQADLSVELALDALEEMGVISNDRYVLQYRAYKIFSKHLQGAYCIIRSIPRWDGRDHGLMAMSRWIGRGDQEIDRIYDQIRGIET